MRTLFVGRFALAVVVAAGCTTSTEPAGQPRYALHRIGNLIIPVGSLVADTLLFSSELKAPATFILTHVQVHQDPDGTRHRSAFELTGSRESDVLTINECPVGFFCIAQFVAAITRFQVVGDSLVEQMGPADDFGPRIYGLVRNSP